MRCLRVLLVTGVFVMSGGSHAQPDPQTGSRGLPAAFGNTIRGIFTDGEQRYWLRSDGTWTGIGRKGRHNNGNWNATEKEVCLTNQNHRTACIRFPEDGRIGSKWKSGVRFPPLPFAVQTLTFELVAGIER